MLDLLYLDRAITQIDDHYSGKTDNHVLLTNRGSIRFTVKNTPAGADAVFSALRIHYADNDEIGDRTATINGAIAVTATDYADVAALRFADDAGKLNGTVQFGSAKMNITVRSDNAGLDDEARAAGIQGDNLTIGQSSSVAAWQGTLNVQANNKQQTAIAIGIDGGNVLEILQTVAAAVTVSATTGGGGKAEFHNGATAIGYSGNILLFKGFAAGATHNISATAGKNGQHGLADAAAFRSSTGAIQIDTVLTGKFTVTAKGGSGNGDSSAKAFALDSGGSIQIGSTQPGLNITVSATGGAGADSDATAGIMRAKQNMLLSASLSGTFAVTATAGSINQDNSQSHANAAAWGFQAEADSLVIVGQLDLVLTVKAQGGSGVNHDDDPAALLPQASAIGFQGHVISFAGTTATNRLTVTATGGSKTALATAEAFGFRTTGNDLQSNGDFAGNYTVTATGGTANPADTELLGDASATACFMASTSAIQLHQQFSATIAVTAKAGKGDSAEAHANGFFSNVLNLQTALKNQKLTVSATGGAGTNTANASAAGAKVNQFGGILEGEFGIWNITATGGKATNLQSGSTTAQAVGMESSDQLSLLATLVNTFTVTAKAGSGTRDNSASAYGFTAQTINLSGATATAKSNISATGGSGGATGASDASADAAFLQAGAAITIDKAFAGNINVTATGGSASGDTDIDHPKAEDLRGGDARAVALRSNGNIVANVWQSNITVTAKAGKGGRSAAATATAFQSDHDGAIGFTTLNAAFTVTATGGAADDNTAATAFFIRTAGNFNTDLLAGRIQVSATAGKAKDGSTAAATAIGIACSNLLIQNMFSAPLTVKAQGGANATDVSAQAAGISATLTNGSLLAELSKSATFNVSAVGGNNGSLATATATGIKFAGTSTNVTINRWFANFTINATAGKSTGAIGGDSRAEAIGLDSTSTIAIDEFTAALTVSAKGGSGNGSQTGSTAIGIRSTNELKLTVKAGAAFTITSTGGTAGSEADATALGIAAQGGQLALTGQHRITATAGKADKSAASQANATAIFYQSSDIGIGMLFINELSANLTVTAKGGSDAVSANAHAGGFRDLESINVGLSSTSLKWNISATAGSNAALAADVADQFHATALAQGLAAQSLNLSSLTLDWQISATGGTGNFSTQGDCNARAIGLQATGSDDLTFISINNLSGKLTVTAKGGNNANDGSAHAWGLDSTQLLSGNSQLTLSVTATAGNGAADSSAEAAAFRAGWVMPFLLNGPLSVTATGGKANGQEQSKASSSAHLVHAQSGDLQVDQLSGSGKVTAQGGSAAQDNSAQASGFYAAQIGKMTLVANAYQLTVNAIAGNSGGVDKDLKDVQANAEAYGFATEKVELTFTANGKLQLTVSATSGNSGNNAGNSSIATAAAFWAGKNSQDTGNLALKQQSEAQNHLINVTATAQNYSGSDENAASATGFRASGDIQYQWTGAVVLNVSAISLQKCDSHAFYSGGTFSANTLNGTFTIKAQAGNAPGGAGATARGIYAEKNITMDGTAGTFTMKIIAQAGTGNGGSACAMAEAFYSSIGGISVQNRMGGNFELAAAAGVSLAGVSSYATAAFLSSARGISVSDGFAENFKLKAIATANTAYAGDAYAKSYGIVSSEGGLKLGAFRNGTSIELAASGGFAGAGAATNNQSLSSKSADAEVIGFRGTSISIDQNFAENVTMKLSAAGGITAVGDANHHANATLQLMEATSGTLQLAGINGKYQLAAAAGTAAAGINADFAGGTKIAHAQGDGSAFRGEAVSIDRVAGTLQLTVTGGRADAKAAAQAEANALAEANAKATACGYTATSSALNVVDSLAGTLTVSAKGGTANAQAYNNAQTIGKEVVAKADASAKATGFSASGDLSIGNIADNFRLVVTAQGGHATASATATKPAEGDNTVPGSASGTATAKAEAIGFDAGGDLTTGGYWGGIIAVTARGGSAKVNGTLQADSTGTAYGIKVIGRIDNLTVNGVIAAGADGFACAIQGGQLVDLTINGALYAGNTTDAAKVADALAKLLGTGKSAASFAADAAKLNGNAYALKGGADSDSVICNNAIIIGDIDLGDGSDTLTVNQDTQIYGNLTSVEKITVNLNGDASANALITLRSEAGATLGDASFDILLDNAQFGDYILVRAGGDFLKSLTNNFIVNGKALGIGQEIRLENGTYVSLTLNTRNELVLTAGLGRNPQAAGDNSFFAPTTSSQPDVRTLLGGKGDDIHMVKNTFDRIVEADHGGVDTVVSGVSYQLGDQVENLFLYGSKDLNATGNSGDNRIAGNAGDNHLNGGGGDDTFVFGANWGHDVVNNEGGSIELLFTDSIRANDLDVATDGDDLRITHRLSGDSVTVKNWAANADNRLSFGDDRYFDNYQLRLALGCFSSLDGLTDPQHDAVKNGLLA